MSTPWCSYGIELYHIHIIHYICNLDYNFQWNINNNTLNTSFHLLQLTRLRWKYLHIVTTWNPVSNEIYFFNSIDYYFMCIYWNQKQILTQCNSGTNLIRIWNILHAGKHTFIRTFIKTLHILYEQTTELSIMKQN